MELIIISSVITISASLVSLYLKSYIKAKATNIAKKEDIQDITKAIENVKYENRKNIEQLKSTLDLQSNREKELFLEQKQAVIHFYYLIDSWIHKDSFIVMHLYNEQKSKNVINSLFEKNDSISIISSAFAKIDLLINDERLIESAKNAHEEILGHHVGMIPFLKNFDELNDSISALNTMIIFKEENITSKETSFLKKITQNQKIIKNLQHFDFEDTSKAYIEECIQQVEKQKIKLDEDLATFNQETIKLISEKVDTFRTLAKSYLNTPINQKL